MVTGGGAVSTAYPNTGGVAPREAGGHWAQPGAADPASRDRPAGRGRGLLRVLDAVEAARVREKPGPVGGGGAAGPGRRLRRLYDGRPRGRELRAVLLLCL